MNEKVNILGTEYKISIRNRSQDSALKELSGYCDHTSKLIVIWDMKNDTIAEKSVENLDFLINSTLRHEIIHAFLFESGLGYDSHETSSWATNEEMVDWIAYQFPKIYKVFKELDCLGE